MKYFITCIVVSLLSVCSQANEILIDGKLSENEWEHVLNNELNYEVSPQTLNESKGNFSYKVLTTSTGLYIGLTANKVEHLRLRTQENDTKFSNDHFQIMLDMNNNAQDAYVFAINHQNNYFDGIINAEKDLDLDWSALWEYNTSADDTAWYAELYIPWQAMSFNQKPQNQFGLYISRFDEKSNATYASSAVSSSMNSFYQQFTTYAVEIDSQAKLDIYPYVSWNRDVLEDNSNSSVGAEIFWQLGKGQKISATINPDFGQVESDELVVNFSAVETLFSEKRPFFNDNQNIFDVEGPENLKIVHTPRIGGESYYDNDYRSDLNSAMKYTINQPNFDIGVLSAFENSTVQGKGRDFYVVRGQYSLGPNKIGISLNKVNTPTIDRAVTVISSDIHVSVSEDTSLNFGVIRTESEVDHSRLRDTGWWVTGSSDITDQHSHEFSLFSYGDGLELNDIGYVKRINRKQFEYEYKYQIPDFSSANIRDIIFSFETELKTNFQDEKLPVVIGAGAEVVTEAEFEYNVSFELISSGVDDLTTRGHHSILLPSAQTLDFELSSPEYFWGKYNLEVTVGKEGWNGTFHDITGSIEHQVSENIHLGVALSQYNSDSWIDWDEENDINEYNFTEQGIELSLNYQFDDTQEVRLKFETVIGKANSIGTYIVMSNGSTQYLDKSDNFSFSESAFQLRYKYALSKLTAFYLSYSFAGEFEDDVARFGKRNLYKQAIDSKNAHNLFAKIRLHF
jgi:hypothetical protein